MSPLGLGADGRCRPVDWRWNQGSHIDFYPDAGRSPFGARELESLRADPWIGDFTTGQKPWHR